MAKTLTVQVAELRKEVEALRRRVRKLEGGKRDELTPAIGFEVDPVEWDEDTAEYRRGGKR